MHETAILVLEDGFVMKGKSFGAKGVALGEAVFSTEMTGYQELLTDPSYAGQILIQTAPHIGNTGINSEDSKSDQVWLAGYVVREISRIPSNWRSEDSLENFLLQHGVVSIFGIDTRALTRHIREKGALKAGIFSGDELIEGASELAPYAIRQLLNTVKAHKQSEDKHA